ncbi:MAG: ketopantoate reductase family protein [Burkholderiales bacterium]|nr:ketopantoate reductase family protein [Burkholderiales bacterium]
MGAKTDVAVVGAGAVGCYYGALLARAGHRVTMVGRAPHVDAMRRAGLLLQRAGGTETVAVAASVELAAVRGAGLVLFCVKATDTDATARALAPHLAPGAVVVSLQNGVENAGLIAARVTQTVIPAVVYVATEMAGPGHVLHHGRGDLVIGPLEAAAAQVPALAATLRAVADVFIAAQVPVRIDAEVMTALWTKLLINCAYNAISALAQAPYGRVAALPEIRALQQALVQEVVAVAAAAGVRLALPAMLQAVAAIAPAMPGQRSSTAQDLARGRRSEIDHLNGFIARRGQALGVPTPINQTLHALVKLVEAGFDAPGRAEAVGDRAGT